MPLFKSNSTILVPKDFIFIYTFWVRKSLLLYIETSEVGDMYWNLFFHSYLNLCPEHTFFLKCGNKTASHTQCLHF